MQQISTFLRTRTGCQRQRLRQYEVQKYPTGAIAIAPVEKGEASSMMVEEK
ncbi:hypothetical protein [Nostoc sp.]|uniref:hypothetical protein n=1 Tax=Nostoc sp. TaxID=1180 RepID=UPI002FF9FE32